MIETKDIVYYIIQSLGILVTGIFSYLVVRFTRQSATAAVESAKALRISVELTQKVMEMQQKKNRDIAQRYAYLLTGEIKHNYLVYSRVDANGHSLQNLLETQEKPLDYEYSRSSHPIKMIEWDDHKKQIIEMDPLLGDELGRIYRRFELLIRHSNVDQLDANEFTGFSQEVAEVLRKIAIG